MRRRWKTRATTTANLPTADAGALTRITRFDVDTGTATAQYAYPLDPVTAPTRARQRACRIWWRSTTRTSWSSSAGYGTHDVARIYRASIAGADNVLGRPSLTGRAAQTMTKTLVVDLSSDVRDAAIWTTSKESRWAPSCPTGRQVSGRSVYRRQLLAPTQITQFYAFALDGRSSCRCRR